MSPSPFCWKALQQHDIATTMLHGRGAIRRVMSCAQFLSYRKLCFMAQTSVSISSRKILFCSLQESFKGVVFLLPSPDGCFTSALGRLQVINCGSSSHISETAALSLCQTALWILRLPPWLMVFLGRLFRLDGVPERVWVVLCFSFPFPTA